MSYVRITARCDDGLEVSVEVDDDPVRMAPRSNAEQVAQTVQDLADRVKAVLVGGS